MRGANKTDYRVTNTRSGVDHEHVEVVADIAERLDQASMLGRTQMNHALCAGRGRDDADAAWPLQQYVAQLTAAFDDVGQGTFGCQSQQDVDIRQPQIGVQQHDAPAELS
ncbi:hypothetical protein D3C84_1003910 [compost metagenome]